MNLSPSSLHFLPASHDWKNDYRQWLPLMLLAWALAWLVRDPFISDWDGYDYTACVVQGVPSALGLGRALFLAYNRALWLTAHHGFGLLPENAYLLIKYGVIAQSGVAALGLYALYQELTASRKAALFSALLIVLSPLYLVYSGRGMSEIPGILLWSWSLWWLLRSLRRQQNFQLILAAALFGLSANMREFALFYLPLIPLIVWLSRKPWKIGLLVFAVAVIASLAGPIFWMVYRPDYYLPALQSWYSLSAQERREHPVTIRNLWFLLGYFFLCAPAAALLFPAACRHFLSHLKRADHQHRLLLLLAFSGLLAMVVLLINHDLPVNPRYLLTGWLGLAPLCGTYLAGLIEQKSRWHQLLLTLLIALTIFSLIGTAVYLDRFQWPGTRAAREYATKLRTLPHNAVFILGRRTPLVNFYRSIGAQPDWQAIPFGAGWPDDRLGEVIDAHLRAGRPVYADFDEPLWVEGLRDHSRERRGLEALRRDYQLAQVSDSLWQIIRRH